MQAEGPDTLEQISLRIKEGAKFDFEYGYDLSAVCKLIQATNELLFDFIYEHREFLLSCLASRGKPADQVGHTLWILRKVRNRLQGGANYGPGSR